MNILKKLVRKLKGQAALDSSAVLGDAPAKKPYGLEDAIRDAKKAEAEMQEKLDWIKTATDDELSDLLGFANFAANSSFNDPRFTKMVTLETLRRIFNKLKSPNDPKLSHADGRAAPQSR
jgi:hypothetical protein